MRRNLLIRGAQAPGRSPVRPARRCCRIGLICGCLLLLTACTTDHTGTIDQMMLDYAGEQTPGAAVLVIQAGKKLVNKGYGLADLDTGAPVTPATNFRLASLTKQFTAAAIMLLVEDGRLTLDTRLSELFPDFNSYAASITVRHLLQHQSGLPDYEPLVPATATAQVLDRDVLQLMAGASDGLFVPGTAYHYSNSGYAVLAMIVEAVSGQFFPEFLHEHIFLPIGMVNTIAHVEGRSSVPLRAFGYRVSDAGVEPADQSLYSAVLGDGGIYSSLDDLHRWDQALYDERLLPRATLALMRTPDLENYGFGWRIDQYRGSRRYHHSGSTSGFRHFMQQFPEQQLTVVVLTNRAEPDVRALAEAIGDLYL